MSGRFGGIDVGERRLHCAMLDGGGRILDCATIGAGDPKALASWFDGARVVAIDAPEAPSTAPHGDRAELPPKFRAARCAEIELGRSHGCWVPWVAPTAPPFPPWMATGFHTYRALDTELLEVYPFAAFRVLAGGRRLARKQTVAGRRERADLLARAGIRGDALAGPPPHDTIDALVAALVALDHSRGRARRVSCGHDASAIWLPGPPV